MNCKECLPLITGYLDGELSELQAAPLRQHLMDCRTCRKSLASEKSLKRWFDFEESLEVEVMVPDQPVNCNQTSVNTVELDLTVCDCRGADNDTVTINFTCSG